MSKIYPVGDLVQSMDAPDSSPYWVFVGNGNNLFSLIGLEVVCMLGLRATSHMSQEP